jgi:hypothetical protein
MLGGSEFTNDPESEQYLSDRFITDRDSAALLDLGASTDGAIRASYALLDADFLRQELLPRVEAFQHTGWLLFA